MFQRFLRRWRNHRAWCKLISAYKYMATVPPFVVNDYDVFEVLGQALNDLDQEYDL